jgi:hypothetical protein
VGPGAVVDDVRQMRVEGEVEKTPGVRARFGEILRQDKSTSEVKDGFEEVVLRLTEVDSAGPARTEEWPQSTPHLLQCSGIELRSLGPQWER